ncbi:MAG: hypothetical protein ACI857_002562 [Arenicella sp.]|jgi:hypothetical protein
MKYLLICLMALTLISCKELEVEKFEYQTVTMMGKTILSVTKDKVIVDFNGRGEPTHFERDTKDSEWVALMSGLREVKLDEVNSLKAPSDKRATDAAPFAKMLFSTPDSTYMSASFDHKNPNAMLMPIMDEILKIQAENAK